MIEVSQAGGHEMLNHEGQVIRVTARTLDALDIRGYLTRDYHTGLKQLTPKNFTVFQEVERGSDQFYELGEDCSGPNQVVCNCERCRALRLWPDAEAGEKAAMHVMSRRAR